MDDTGVIRKDEFIDVRQYIILVNSVFSTPQAKELLRVWHHDYVDVDWKQLAEKTNMLMFNLGKSEFIKHLDITIDFYKEHSEELLKEV